MTEEIGGVDGLDGVGDGEPGGDVSLGTIEMEVVDLALGGGDVRGGLTALERPRELEV